MTETADPYRSLDPTAPPPPAEPETNVWSRPDQPVDPYGATPYGAMPVSGGTLEYPVLPVPYPPPPATPQAPLGMAGYGVGQPAPVFVVRPSSGVAVAAMVLGIVGFLTNVCVCGIPSLAAIVLGHIGLAQTRGGAVAGRGMAVTGLVLGYLVFIPVVIAIVFFGAFGFIGSIVSLG